MACHKSYFNSLFSRRRRISAVAEYILLWSHSALRWPCFCLLKSVWINIHRQSRSSCSMDAVEFAIVAINQIVLMLQQQRHCLRRAHCTLKLLAIVNEHCKKCWCETEKKVGDFLHVIYWTTYLPHLYIQLPVGQRYSWGALGGSLSYQRSAITQRVRSWNWPRRSKIIIISTWRSVSCSPNVATDVIRKRCCCCCYRLSLCLISTAAIFRWRAYKRFFVFDARNSSRWNQQIQPRTYLHLPASSYSISSTLSITRQLI